MCAVCVADPHMLLQLCAFGHYEALWKRFLGAHVNRKPLPFSPAVSAVLAPSPIRKFLVK
jgi:hypothetical protein